MLPCPLVQDPQSLQLLPLTCPCEVSQTPELPAVSPPALGLPPPSPTGSLPTAAPESQFSATSPGAPESQRSIPRPQPTLPTPQQRWARRAAPLLPNCLPSAGHHLLTSHHCRTPGSASEPPTIPGGFIYTSQGRVLMAPHSHPQPRPSPGLQLPAPPLSQRSECQLHPSSSSETKQANMTLPCSPLWAPQRGRLTFPVSGSTLTIL